MQNQFGKGSLWASFFIFLICVATARAAEGEYQALINQADANHIAETRLWHVLLHLKHDQPINPTSHYLSSPFSPQAELRETIKLALRDPQAACAFPARKRYIETQLNLPAGTLSPEPCSDYETFLDFVPNDRLVLVYASENVNSASSMMGHIMLRLDGVNINDIAVQHGITYFAELDSLNAARILYDSLVTGKEGLFQVSPYAPIQAHYRYAEQRNIWEYALTLTPGERALIRDAIWEIGQHTPAYFFHTYNCATVTQLLLAIARPASLDTVDAWLTPIDIVKFSYKVSLVDSARVVPSDRWKTNALLEQMPDHRVDAIGSAIDTGNIANLSLSVDSQGYTEFELAKSINSLWFSQRKISEARYQDNKLKLAQMNSNYSAFQIDVSDYKSPLDATDESLISVGVGHIENRDALLFRYFPVASDITDDHGHIFGENQLLLADTRIRLDVNGARLHLDKLSLYQMNSRVPYTSVTGGISSGLRVGLERVVNDQFNTQLVANVEGAVGLSYELTDDIGLYAEAAAGVMANLKRSEVYVEPRVGAYLYAIYNTKLNANVGWAVNKFIGKPLLRYDLSVRTQLNKNSALFLSVDRQLASSQSLKNVSVYYQYRF